MKVVNSIAAVFVLCLLVISCENTSTTTTKENSKTGNNNPEPEIKEDSIKNNVSDWEYTEETDKMGEKIYYAHNTSKDELGMRFPYENSYGSLLVRNRNGKNEVIFMVTKGQIKGYVYEGGTARIKFDEDKPVTIGYNSASDGSSEVVFFKNPKMIIDKLKNSERTVLEVEFYDNGIRQMEFNTSGFEWQH